LEAGHDRGVALDAAGATDGEPEPPETPEAVPDEAVAVVDPAVLDAVLLGAAGPVQPGNLLGTTAPQIALL